MSDEFYGLPRITGEVYATLVAEMGFDPEKAGRSSIAESPYVAPETVALPAAFTADVEGEDTQAAIEPYVGEPITPIDVMGEEFTPEAPVVEAEAAVEGETLTQPVTEADVFAVDAPMEVSADEIFEAYMEAGEQSLGEAAAEVDEIEAVEAAEVEAAEVEPEEPMQAEETEQVTDAAAFEFDIVEPVEAEIIDLPIAHVGENDSVQAADEVAVVEPVPAMASTDLSSYFAGLPELPPMSGTDG